MIIIENFISDFYTQFPREDPWEIVQDLEVILWNHFDNLDDNFIINNGIAIHKTAIVEQTAILRSPVIIGENCFIGSNACLRNGVFLSRNVKIGMGVEIKTSIVFDNSAVAHFNFIGDSIIGKNVNFEAGAITANHYNEREDKQIFVKNNEEILNTNVEKFGALIGDFSKIGANAVLSSGTILKPNSIVKRLELIEQVK